MRSLFLRIFVYYWIATGMVVSTAVITTSWLGWQRVTDLDELEPSSLTDSATAALAKGGRDGLRAWTEAENRSIVAPDIYMVDQTGHDLLGRSVSENLYRRSEMAVVALRAGKNWTWGPRFAAVISSPTSGSYMLIVTAATSGPLAALGDLPVLAAMMLLTLAIVGMVCWVVARTITLPVVRLQVSAQALAGGHLGTRVGHEISSRSDELGALARDFDLMADKLRVMLSSKEALMRDLSHELRSPLARMRVALGLARASQVTTEVQFARIEREAERMDALIGQLLRLSRLMNVELKPDLQPVDLSELVQEVVEDTRLEAFGTTKSIEWHDPGQVRVLADAEMIRHAIENVLRNALRFSPALGVIRVILARTSDRAVLFVQDQGPGVPDASLGRIFEPFYRAQTSEGTGVGLAITAKVIELHDGIVTARNRPNGGLEVEFRLKAIDYNQLTITTH